MKNKDKERLEKLLESLSDDAQEKVFECVKEQTSEYYRAGIWWGCILQKDEDEKAGK